MKSRKFKHRYTTRYVEDYSPYKHLWPKSKKGWLILKQGETGYDDHNCWNWYIIARFKP